MKVIIIGGAGVIGSAIVKQLSPRNEVVVASRSHGELTCDITSQDSIRSMFSKVGEFHAVIVTAGNVHFDDLSQMTPVKYRIGLEQKLLAQVNVVLIGSRFIQDGGSFTLTSGILSRDPIRAGSSGSMVNGAIEGFVIGAAIELPRGIRINAVSPTVVAESMDTLSPYFRGFDPVPADKVALAYSKSVEGLQTGQIYRVAS